MDLVTFLRARLDEDEELARRAEPALEGGFPDYRTYSGPEQETADEFLDHFTPARVLREVNAKRRIVAMMAGSPDFHDAMPTPGYAQPYHSPSIDVLVRVCQLLALPYDQHPDYNPEWKV